MTSLIKTPFADTGDKSTIPDTDASGNVNWAQGFPGDYSKDPDTDASAKRIEREDFNGLINQITKAISEIQKNGITPFITAADNGGSAFQYSKGAVTTYNGVLYVCTADTTDIPGTTTNWTALPDGVNGRLVSVQVLTGSGTFTPFSLTKSVIVEVQGAGGGGGGTTGLGQASHKAAAGGGGAGGYAKARLLSGFAGATYSCGVGGAGGAANAQNANQGVGKGGGDTLFTPTTGSAIRGSGGFGGTFSSGWDMPIHTSGAPSGIGQGGNILNHTANHGTPAYYANNGWLSGAGASSLLGFGGIQVGGNGQNGTDATGFGSGGGGAVTGAGSSGFNGGRGSNGAIIVWEYS